jgi:HSP20 family protein
MIIMTPTVIHHLYGQVTTLFLFHNLLVMYPGVPSLASFTPKKAEPVQFVDNQEAGVGGPASNISEFPSEYRLELAVPGLKRQEFSIQLSEGVISISGKSAGSTQACINDRCEFDYHDWTRAFVLPEDADAIMTQATYKDGELVIHIPRDKKAESKALVTVTVY